MLINISYMSSITNSHCKIEYFIFYNQIKFEIKLYSSLIKKEVNWSTTQKIILIDNVFDSNWFLFTLDYVNCI